jgi:hypothetical protein
MDRAVVTLFAGFLAFMLAACGSSTQTVTGPSTNKCALTATADTSSFKAAGGSGNITVSTNRECQWAAQASTSWVTLGSGSSGQGDGKFPFAVASNIDPAARRASVIINDQQITITEDAAPCQFTVSPVADTVSPSGDRRTIAVTVSNAQCSWTAKSNNDWLTIASGAQDNGNGTVVYDAQPTTGPTRTGSLSVAGQTVTVTQGTGCSVSISPTGAAIGAAGGSGSLAVNAGAGCTWAATGSDPWITLTSGTTGTGTGTVAFTVSAWNGPTRTGTINVNGQLFTVTQGAGCSFSLSTSSSTVGAGGGSGNVQVAAANGCGWNASSNASWITITSGGSGSGNGTVQFTAAATTGSGRTGTLTIANQTFTVIQSSCSYTSTLAGPGSFDATGGSGSVQISTTGTCAWTASSNQSWIHLSAGSGTGSGTITFTVDKNTTSSSRTANITAGGQTLVITQAAPCSYSLSATSVTIPYTGGSGSVSVTTGGSCTWTASAPDPWARITAGASGTGNGTVQFVVDQNSGAGRVSTLTIAGIAFTISQDPVPAPCTFSISPTNANYTDAATHAGTFALTASASTCTWFATSDPWITVTSGTSGTGSATISYSIPANVGPARTGSISIGGQTFTITQASGCTISIAPTSQLIDAVGGGGTITITASDPACGWVATPDVPWITISAGASGTGNGTVTFTVAANTTGAARTGHIDVSGQTFTVNQN